MTRNTLDEMSLWRSATSEQQSFLSQVLHWFHFRPRALKGAWMLEEPLTWELFRALDLLPRSLFANPLLRGLGELAPAVDAAVTPLLSCSELAITPYPSLQLSGARTNCRSDLGFGIGSSPRLWLEAKTAPFAPEKIIVQLREQQLALESLSPSTPVAVVALLPAEKVLTSWPSFTWSAVANALESAVVQLRYAFPDPEFRSGYERLALELVNRIKSHPSLLAAQQAVAADGDASGKSRRIETPTRRRPRL